MLSERIKNTVTGLWMICCGVSLFIFALMLGPYMNSLSVIMFCIIAIPSAAVLGVGISVLVVRGVGMALGHITIRTESLGGK
jgi:hypothetical protein